MQNFPRVYDGRDCGHHAADPAKAKRLLRQVTAPAPMRKAQVGQGQTAVVVLSLAEAAPGETIAHKRLTALIGRLTLAAPLDIVVKARRAYARLERRHVVDSQFGYQWQACLTVLAGPHKVQKSLQIDLISRQFPYPSII